jgi:hypothetical protein
MYLFKKYEKTIKKNKENPYTSEVITGKITIARLKNLSIEFIILQIGDNKNDNFSHL